MTGTLKTEDEKIKKFPDKIRVTSVKDPALKVQVPVDTTGGYSVALPPGTL